MAPTLDIIAVRDRIALVGPKPIGDDMSSTNAVLLDIDTPEFHRVNVHQALKQGYWSEPDGLPDELWSELLTRARDAMASA